jgi:hypothetical protein
VIGEKDRDPVVVIEEEGEMTGVDLEIVSWYSSTLICNHYPGFGIKG